MKQYKIEVYMSARDIDNPSKPYFWVLWSKRSDDWCNDCCGWAATPDAAWSEAQDFYQNFKMPQSN